MTDFPLSDLDRLVATEAIRSLQSRYVRLADGNEWRALADLFLPEGEFVTLDLKGKAQGRMAGRDEIYNRLTDLVGSARATHHLFSYEIELVAADRARGTWSMEDRIERPAPGEPGEMITVLHGRGHYHVDYEKRGGTWFIASQTLHRSFLETAQPTGDKA